VHGQPGEPNVRATEGTRIEHNNIHHVTLKHIDGGGIYVPGSHLDSQATGRLSTLHYNYIHDLVLNPSLNAYPIVVPPPPELPYVDRRSIASDKVVKAFYFESGADGWDLRGNYVEHCQAPYSFNPQLCWVPDTAACAFVPTGFPCSHEGGCDHPIEPSNWWGSTWPEPATVCGAFVIPGQHWWS
jgi:hypothetical protein